jgi:hypothetical protein
LASRTGIIGSVPFSIAGRGNFLAGSGGFGAALAFILALAPLASALSDFLEDAEEKFSFSAFDGRLRLKLSGILDLETYEVDKPAPALIYTDNHFLFNPRLTLYLDAQLTPAFYFFVQARADRGFDPSDNGAQVRLDEYVLRVAPLAEKTFPRIQIGKFATVVGNWVRRHDSWDNPLINAPLAYENLLGLWDSVAPPSVATIFFWGHVPFDGVRKFGDGYSDKIYRIPLIWGPSYATGLSVVGALDKFDYAFEIKNAALSSRPESWDLTRNNFDHPTFSGRVGFKPNIMWDLGVSGSIGPYLQPEASSTLPMGDSIGDFKQVVLGQDVTFAWRYFQLWAEVFEARFELPDIGNADLLSYYVEAKYKITPELFVAARWNQQLYGDLPYRGKPARWGNDAWRVDAAIGYRFSAYLQLKLQGSYTHHDEDVQEGERLIAAQLTLKF